MTAKVNVRNKEGRTPLLEAGKYGHNDVAEILTVTAPNSRSQRKIESGSTTKHVLLSLSISYLFLDHFEQATLLPHHSYDILYINLKCDSRVRVLIESCNLNYLFQNGLAQMFFY